MYEGDARQYWQQRIQANIDRQNARHDVAAGVYAGNMAAYATVRAIEQRQRQAAEYAAWWESLSPEERQAEIEKQDQERRAVNQIRVKGLLLMAAAVPLFMLGGWFATAGFLLGLYGLSRVVFGGR